ncbi:MAG: bifunctional glutamate N-acetyltransferase/amino-acid acetyltransferase ArgJ [Spirochaetaceae bacterium]|jgi:glutamate N-acetyltransferase/amino-acid N-acetyltransferase|nr:bifunctional glutamate N-acetyltransferase/amino-acid acetyltransferase ArgJ [Spirochaetaceae bacterium]
MEKLKELPGGICAPRGFKAGGVRAGIKAGASKRDLALVYSDRPCSSAAVFTRNRVQAASVIVSREHLKKSGGRIRALIANSGNANACTGETGLAAARRMAALGAEKLALRPEECAVASTGVIGVPLPLPLIEAAMDELAASLCTGADGALAALEAIMTTDTRKKQGALQCTLPRAHDIRIGAMTKGSGMIHPSMATMICLITTDAALSPAMLDRALRRAVDRSFNRLTVDGDMSTNDMVLIMAGGAAENEPIETEGEAYEVFAGALETLCVKLARAMARDGEGASRLITVTVAGAASEADAAVLARSVAGSSLVKAACFGADANWGRVLCALGYAGIPFDPAAAAISFKSAEGSIPVCRDGASLPFSEAEAKKILSRDEIEILIDLNGRRAGQAESFSGGSEGAGSGSAGPGSASAWGCDLSFEYVKINGDYRS